MDIGALVGSLGVFDLVAFILVGLGIVSGVIQGPIRRILGILIAVFVLLLALNLRIPVGDWLAGYWSRDSTEYARFIAAGASFAILYITAMLAAQVYVKPVDLFPNGSLKNEVVGGLLGAVEAVIVLGAVILIMDSYFRSLTAPVSPNEIGVLRSLFHFYDDSLTAHIYRDWLIPTFLFAFGWILPDSVHVLFTR